MIQRHGSIWVWQAEKRWVVIPTNIGWKKDGSNPMGAGVAAQAASMYDDLKSWYGARCKKYGADTAVCPYYPGNLIMFPTKSLNVAQPWSSWQMKSDIELIRRGAIQLEALGQILTDKKVCFGEIGLPLVGCGAGGLDRSDVVAVLDKYLSDRFVLLETYG